MLKKEQIKAKIRKLKYFDSQLNERRDLIEAIGKEMNEVGAILDSTPQQDDVLLKNHVTLIKQFEKDQKRYKSELELVMKLFQAYMITTFPKSYDWKENPKQRMTQKEARIIVISPLTKEAGFVQRGAYKFMYVEKEELYLLETICNEMKAI